MQACYGYYASRENMLQVMHFDKSWYKKNDRLHIEIMIL